MSVDNVVVVLLDSLNRHMLGSYGGTEFDTPNLDRFAAARRCASPATSPVRCRACRRATTSCAARSTSCGGRGARSSCGRTRSPHRSAAPASRRCWSSDHPHLFETGGENYHTDFDALGLPARPRGRPVADRAPDPRGSARRRCPRPRAARRAAVTTTSSRTWFRDEADFPGPRTMAAAADWLDAPRRPPRPLPAVRRRVRPARAVRHAGAVGTRYDPDWDGEPHHLAAVRRRRGARGPARRARGAAHPRQLRREAVDDRPLVRPVARRARRPGLLGRHRGDRVHRPRPLPRARRTSGASRGCRMYEPLGHIPLLVAWPGARRRSTCDALTTRSTCRHARRRLRRDGRPAHARPLAGAAARRARPTQCATGRSAACGAAGCTSPTARRKYARGAGERQPAAVDVVEPLVDDAGARLARLACPARPPRRARLHAGYRRAGDPPAVRARRPRCPFWAGPRRDQHHVRPRQRSDENEDLVGTRDEAEMIDLLRAALEDVEAPDEQFERLGLA